MRSKSGSSKPALPANAVGLGQGRAADLSVSFRESIVKQVVLIFILQFAVEADARFVPFSTEKAIKRAEVIVDATVISSRVVEWFLPSGYRSCGYEHKLRINQNFVGNAGIQTIIGSGSPLAIGCSHL